MKRTGKLLCDLRKLDVRLREAEEACAKVMDTAVKTYAGSGGPEKRAQVRDELMDAELEVESLRRRRMNLIDDLAKAVERDLADEERIAGEELERAREAAKALEEEIARTAGRLVGLWVRRYGPSFVPGMDYAVPCLPEVEVDGRSARYGREEVFREGYTQVGGVDVFGEALGEIARAETEGRRLRRAEDLATAVAFLRAEPPQKVSEAVLRLGEIGDLRRLSREVRYFSEGHDGV